MAEHLSAIGQSGARRRRGAGLAATLCVGCLFALLTMLTHCTQPLDVPPLQAYMAKVDLDTAIYGFGDGSMRVCWHPLPAAPAPDAPSYYRLMRYTSVDGSGEPLDLVRSAPLPAGDTDYVDHLDLLRGYYYYYVVAYRIEAGDTLQSRNSDTTVVLGGSGVSYEINHGARTISQRACTLYVHNATRLARSVRFTQKVERYLAKGATRVVVSTLDTFRFTDADKAALSGLSLWDPVNKTLYAGVIRGTTPLFDAVDAENAASRGPFPLTAADADTLRSFPWLLETGKEEKRVFAEIQMDTNGANPGGVFTDTVSYGMPISPYRVRPRLDNRKMTFYPNADVLLESRYGPSDATMIYTHTEGSQGLSATEEYILSSKFVRFTLRIDVDLSIATTFEYWLVTSNLVNGFNAGFLPTDTAKLLLETSRRTGALTDSGAGHDEDFVYEYSIDPATPEGRENLDTLRRVTNPIGYPYVDYGTPVVGTADDNFRRFTGLSKMNEATSGVKQFALCFHFKGRYFGEDRYYVTQVVNSDGVTFPLPSAYAEPVAVRSGLNRTIYNNYYFDFYRPKITFSTDPANAAALQNGDTVTTLFDFALDAASVVDMGKARVTDVKLIISRVPEVGTVLPSGTVWTANTWNYKSWTGDTLVPVALEDLYALRTAELPYPLRLPWRQINDVAWREIDPSEWPSGQYFFGIVASDEYGNEGLASAFFQPATYSTNPFMVTVLTGR